MGDVGSTTGGDEASDQASRALSSTQRSTRDLRKVCVIGGEPLLARGGRESGVLWAHQALSVQESQEMAEALGRLREVAGPVPREPGDIVLKDSLSHRADGRALLVQPSGKLITGAQRALAMTRCLPFVMEEGGEVLQVRPQGPAAQASHHGRPDQEVCEPGLRLCRHGCLEKEKRRMSGSCRVERRATCRQY